MVGHFLCYGLEVDTASVYLYRIGEDFPGKIHRDLTTENSGVCNKRYGDAFKFANGIRHVFGDEFEYVGRD